MCAFHVNLTAFTPQKFVRIRSGRGALAGGLKNCHPVKTNKVTNHLQNALDRTEQIKNIDHIGNKPRLSKVFHLLSTVCQLGFEPATWDQNRGSGWKVIAMLGFLIVTLFALAAALAVAVLTDSTLRGARAYRDLSVRVGCGEQYNSVVFKIEQFERSLAEPSFRMRPVNRSTGPHQMARRRAVQMSVAA